MPNGLVAGPISKPRRYGLVNSETLVREPDNYWANGFQFEATECQYTVTLYGRDCRPAGAGKAATGDTVVDRLSAGSGSASVDYVPFLVRVERECKSLLPGQVSEVEKDVVDALERCTQRAIEHEAYTGHLAKAMHAPNAYLKQTGVTNGGTATSGVEILGLLEAGVAGCGCGAPGVLHLNPKDAALVLATGVDFDYDPVANTIHTPSGNLIVIGAGYGVNAETASSPGVITKANPNPAITVNHTTSDLKKAYATGPVQVRMTDPEVTSVFDREKNEHTIVAERFAAATWAPCCHVEVTTP